MKKSFLFKISTLIIIILATAGCNNNQNAEVEEDASTENITSPVEMSSTKDDEEDDSSVNFENGRWISTEDANSGIEIRDDKWIMFYKGTDQSPRDVYDYKVERKPVNETDPDAAMITYLTISNSNETLEYALLEYNENLLSLSYVPRGNTLNYKPE